MGIPIIVAGQVTSIDPFPIGAMAGRQLPLLSVFVPFWIIMIMDGWKGVRETWPAILVAGGTFAVTQYFTANFIGPELPDITSALVSLVSITLFLKVWKPKRIFRFDHSPLNAPVPASVGAMAVGEFDDAKPTYTGGEIFKAWSPFLILTAIVTVWSLKPFKALFAKGGALADTVLYFPIAGLDKLVIKATPIVTSPKPYDAIYKLDLLSATGTAILISAIVTMVMLKMRPMEGLKTFGETVNELKRPIYSIGMVLAFAFIANYSGLSSTLALLLAGTGALFPFFSPILGWLGVFLTGSDTSSNALFCALQATTAQQVGVSDTLMVAANTTGGVTGKMISPQSIAVACAAVGLVGRESELFRFTVKHSLFFVAIIGVITYLQAYVFPWMIP
jgi:L-lactate permease/lactate permease